MYQELPVFFQAKRDYFRKLLATTKLELLPCKGAYFQCVTYQNISDESDVDFAKRLVSEIGVAAIPLSAFYSKNTSHKILRFCFAKEDGTLEKAVAKLIKL